MLWDWPVLVGQYHRSPTRAAVLGIFVSTGIFSSQLDAPTRIRVFPFMSKTVPLCSIKISVRGYGGSKLRLASGAHLNHGV